MNTHRAKSAISLGISALIIIVLILIVGLGAWLATTTKSTTATLTLTQNMSNNSATIGSTSTSSSSSSVQSETGTEATCTAIGAISYMYCPTPLRISAVGTPGASPPNSCPSPCNSWNFTVTINSTSVARGQSILLRADLTNLGSNETFSQWVGPYINPTVTNSDRVQVWAWDPIGISFGNFTVTSGQTISQDADIPTSALISGQSYFISVAPLSLQFPTPNNYTFTFEFSVS